MRHLSSVWLVLVGLCVGALAHAQERDLASAARGPRFLVRTNDQPVPIDVRQAPHLHRRISVQFDDVTLGEALAEISRQGRLPLLYSKDLVPLDTRVRLRAENITVAGALSEVLIDAGVDVLLSADGRAALVKRVVRPVPPAPGTVAGQVTDAKTGEGLAGAEVRLEGTRWRIGATEDGRYRLVEVEPGEYTLVVRRIGYTQRRQAITVVSGQELTVDVALEPRPTQLDEVVTTVTGEQRLRELGHVVGRINADSVVKEAPISTLSELLTARVPGLQVFQRQGTVGGEVHVQIRGANSILLGTEPIVVVDGVRYTRAAAQQMVFTGPGMVEPTSPLNDLNPNDIESIEVVKGPSAATLYGTDAANGVIVITTKRGRGGPARWNAYARGVRVEVPKTRQPDQYWGWTSSYGDEYVGVASCGLVSVAKGHCTQDSVTVLPSPLSDPDLSILQAAPSWQYGANVAGGQQDFRYYFSGDVEQAIGGVRMPPAVAREMAAEQGLSELPEEMRNPNRLTKVSLRANLTAALGASGELRSHIGYVRGSTRSLAAGYRNPYLWGVAYRNGLQPYSAAYGPRTAFAQTSTEETDRFFGSVGGDWRPTSWFLVRATVGLDLTARLRASLARRGEIPDDPLYVDGAVSDERVRQATTTAKLDATVTARRGWFSARTSIGVQYDRSLSNGLAIAGRNLPPGGSSIGEAAAIVTRSQAYRETVTLGSYLEETLGLNDRLFVSGALRVDGASAFGQRYDATVYPKVSASWLASEEPFFPRLPFLDDLRFRYAFGASGQQPLPSMTQPLFARRTARVRGSTMTVVSVEELGNPNLRPERVREHELGMDVSALQSRVQLGLTWYKRRTTDQIVYQYLPPGLGTIYTNLGLTTQHGFEAELRARVLDLPALSWDVMAQHGLHRTTLVDIGGATLNPGPAGGYVEGYPLGARFNLPIVHYADANGDGAINPDDVAELQLGAYPDELVYAGESVPPISQSFGTTVGLFRQRLRFSALFERRSGFTQINSLQVEQCFQALCRTAVDPSTSLAEQAEVAALRRGAYRPIEPGDFTRLRELTVAVDLPGALLRPLHVRSATLALSGRNLALWTDFGGPDPESSSNGLVDGVPQARSWVVRVDVGL